MPPHVVASMLLNLAAANEIGLDAEDVRGVLAAVAPIVRNGPCRVRNGQIARALAVAIRIAEEEVEEAQA